MPSFFELFDNALNLFAQGDRFQGIEAMRDLLEAIDGDPNVPLGAYSEAVRHLGNMLDQVGEAAQAQELRRKALMRLDMAGNRGEWFGVVMEGDLGRGYEALGDMDRAAEAWEKAHANQKIASWDKPHVIAMTLVNATAAAIYKEEWEKAACIAKQALEVCEVAGPAAQDLLARAKLNQETIALQSGALAVSEASREPVGDVARLIQVRLNHLAVYVQEGRPAEGLTSLEEVLSKAFSIPSPVLAVKYWTAVARLRQMLEKPWDDVIAAARHAVDVIASLRGPLEAHGFSPGPLRMAAQDAFELLALGLLVQNRVDEAFDVFERSRARRLMDDLRHDQGSPDKTSFEQSLDDLREEIRGILGRLTMGTDSDGRRNIVLVAKRPETPPSPWPAVAEEQAPDPARVTLKSNDLTAAQNRYLRHLRDIAETASDERCYREFTVASLDEVRQSLTPDELLIVPFAMRTHLVTLMITRERVIRHGVKVDLPRLEQLVAECRDRLRDPSAEIPVLNTHLAALGRMLFGTKENPKRFKTVIWAPSGPLADLPLGVIRVGGRYLVQQTASVCLPMASFAVNQAPGALLGKLVAMGNPDHHNPYLALPHAETEVQAIGRLFAGRVAIRDEASAENLRRWSPETGMLHLACHALFDRDHPGFSLLRLAPSDPSGAGLVLASDIPSLDLNCSLVTLSACQAGLTREIQGADIGGLSVAFLTSGCRSVLAGLWSVDDAATERLMIAFYTHLRGLAKAEALRRACLEVQTQPGFGHPAFWAPFILLGDWH